MSLPQLRSLTESSYGIRKGNHKGQEMNAVHFSEAVCKRIRTQLDHYLSNELSVETNHEVMRHLEACAACAGELDARMRVRGFLRQAIESETAPPALRQRIEGCR